MTDDRPRCPWGAGDPVNLAYHDEEWGVPIHDDKRLFELLNLEGAQAGLAWITILRKRDGYRRAFDGWDPERIAAYGPDDEARLLADTGIVRNSAKVRAAIGNARAYLSMTAAPGAFDRYVWSFVNGHPIQNRWTSLGGVPAETDESRALSRDLKKRGFSFVGPTIVYAFMQSAGLVNDHLVSCFRYSELTGVKPQAASVYSARMPTPIATIEVPASSANLGSGFDCFAAALSLKLRAELHAGDEAGIVLNAHGEGAPGPDDDPEQNLLIRAFREGLRLAHGSERGSGAWRIEVSSMIPAARGLGSSAAAIVAGLLLGAAAGRHAPDADELFTLGATLEGHPDNVAACLYGGITLSVAGGVGSTPLLRRFRVPEAWIPVLFIASATSRTQGMREALPATVPHHEAAAATARAALLATAVITSDAGLLRTAMDDRLHQPYRLPLLAGSAELIELGYEHGAAGAALSGAGPSVLAICDSPVSAHSVEKAWSASGWPGMATRLRFDTDGARLSAEPARA